LVALLLAGCGGLTSIAVVPGGTQLTVYSSLPLHGSGAEASAQIVNGERLALSQAGGHVGPFKVSFSSVDDSNPASGQWSSGNTATNAATAAHDVSTIAYIGDYDSAASAVSLPLINGAGILQLSPASPYVGLTDTADAGQDEPYRFYPTGMRTFGRIAPDDYVQGAAIVAFMRAQGTRRLYVVGDQDPFESSLSEIVASDARAARIRVIATDTIDTDTGTFTAEAHRIALSGADAMFYGGGATKATATLWQEVYAVAPGLRLYGSSAANVASFTAGLGQAANNLFLGSPTLPKSLYGGDAQRFFRNYQLAFGQPATAEALYGYAAMQLVLEAIRRAGPHGNSRAAVVHAFFAMGPQDGVLGRLAISHAGDSSLADYAIDRIVGGLPVFDRVLRVPTRAPTSV
jgi:branched-chain amino acid transport system substrate-binding protein